MPTMSMDAIRALRAEVKILEAKRMGILSCAALLANTLGQDKRADMARRLLRFWSGFKTSFAKLLDSDAYGDFAFALEEIKKMKPRHGPLSLSVLPQRVYRRYQDYAQGTKSRRRWKHRNESHESVDAVFKRAKEEDEEDTLPDPIDAHAIKTIIDAINELPSAERNALEKMTRGEKLTTAAERKAKSRALPKLREILKK